MTASGRKLNVEAPLAAKACLVGVSPTGTQMRIAGSCGLCWSEGIARLSLATSRQAYRTEGDRPTVRQVLASRARKERIVAGPPCFVRQPLVVLVGHEGDRPHRSLRHGQDYKWLSRSGETLRNRIGTTMLSLPGVKNPPDATIA